jgi:tetratricopeptide (TPR) repeat protein
MARKLIISAGMICLVFIIGCEEPIKNDPRYLVDPDQAANIVSMGGVPDATEVDLVEDLMARRAEYRQSLAQLHEYYHSMGNVNNRRWAQHEMDALDSVPQYLYLQPGQAAPSTLVAVSSDAQANALFKEAERLYREATGLVIFIDEDKMRGALSRYNRLIEEFPTSNKIDDAAYQAGRIYEHFKDWQIAADYYQRCFQWNEVTARPARFRAAYVTDQRLHKRTEALPLYQMAVEKESNFTANTEFARKRILELIKSNRIAPSKPNSSSIPSEGGVDTYTEKLGETP